MAIKLKNKKPITKEIENVECALDLDYNYNEHYIFYFDDGSEKIITVCIN
jgi:hypothetical protein